ncbi:hypothetical protein BH09BAC1_BH09BAC1_09260 [soil metagenome]
MTKKTMQLIKYWAMFALVILVATNGLQAQCLPAGNYTINATQPASGTNYQSFTAAVAAMSCGIQGPVTFTVAYGSGPYNEQVTIPVISGASPTARVTFDGQHRDSTILAHNGTLTQYATLLINGADNIIIKNLTVRNASLGAGFGIQLTNAADSNVIKNVKVLLDVNTQNTSCYGIVASASLTVITTSAAEGNNANNLLIDSVTITGGHGGIRIEGATAILLKKNRITNCHISQVYNVGIMVDDSDSLIVHGNYIHDVRDIGGGYGLYLTDTKGYFELIGNQVYARDWNIYLTNGNTLNPNSRAKIINNFSASTGAYGMYLTNNDRVDVFNNTVVGSTGIRLATNSKYMDFRNNIFYGTQSYAFDDAVLITTSNHLNIDYNIYYTAGINLIRYNFVNYASLAAWQADFPALNIHSLQGEPIFYALTNLHVLDTLANNKGDNSVGVAIDVDRETRPMAPATRVDIGADEYTPFANNLKVVGLWNPQPADCGGNSSPVSIVVYNEGANPQTGFTVSAVVIGPSGTQNISTINTGTLLPWTYDTIVVGNINNFQGGVYTVHMAHQLATDQYTANDTLSTTLSFLANIGSPIAVGDTACIGNVLELTANASGYIDLEWFSDAALTTNVGSGNTFFTPVLNTSTTYYVQGQQGTIERGGKPGLGTSPLPNDFVSETPGWGLEFEVTRSVSIDSISTFPLGTGTFTVSIHKANNTGVVYTSPPFTVTTGNGSRKQYYLGAFLPPGNYVMGIADTAGTVTLLRDPSGTAGPYVSPSGFVTVKGARDGFINSPTPTKYYWFYDWVIRIPSCFSAPTPVVAFISDSLSNAGINTAICRGGSTTLTAGNGVAWAWSNSDVTASTVVSPTNTATYSLTITDANGCQGRPGQVTVTVNSLPLVTLGNDITICSGDTTTLNASGATTYVWSNTLTTSSIDVTAAGIYSVIGTDANGCVNYDTVAVSVNALPIVLARAPVAICAGDTATLTVGGASTYIWSNAVTGSNIKVTAGGNYIVTGTDTNGCKGIDTTTVTINALPNVSVGADIEICNGDTAHVSATGAITYLWSNSATGANIETTIPGRYEVTGTDANGCKASDTLNILVNLLPAVVASNDISICIGDTAHLDVAGAITYAWSNGSVGASINVTTMGNYIVTGTDVNGCKGQDSTLVTVNSLPNVDGGGDASICTGDTASLMATGASIYVWSNGDNGAAIDVATAGIYSVTGTDANGCANADTLTVAINTLPIVSASADATICAGDTAVLSAFGADFYTWSSGDSGDNIEVLSNGNYMVTGTDINGCRDTASVSVTVNLLPVLTFSVADTLCHDNPTVTLTATPSGGTFLGEGVVGDVFDFSSLTLPGDFILQYVYTDANQCSATATEVVTVVICEGVEEIADLGQINIYPNPFQNEVNIRLEALQTGIATITVYDFMGKLIFAEEVQVEQNTNNFVLGLGDTFAAGAYMIELKQGNGIYRQQLLHIK